MSAGVGMCVYTGRSVGLSAESVGLSAGVGMCVYTGRSVGLSAESVGLSAGVGMCVCISVYMGMFPAPGGRGSWLRGPAGPAGAVFHHHHELLLFYNTQLSPCRVLSPLLPFFFFPAVPAASPEKYLILTEVWRASCLSYPPRLLLVCLHGASTHTPTCREMAGRRAEPPGGRQIQYFPCGAVSSGHGHGGGTRAVFTCGSDGGGGGLGGARGACRAGGGGEGRGGG